jgi:N-acetylneuraminate synthase
VSFFDHRGVEYAIMHCISIYPTPTELCNLNQIDRLRERYPGRTIGWSTHEEPDNLVPVHVAVAKGAAMFERHVGIATDTIKLNAYSSTPEQVDRWIAAWKAAVAACGPYERAPSLDVELASIDSLRRGVYAKKPIKAGAPIRRDQVYFAMPYVEGQLASGAWKEGVLANADVAPDRPVPLDAITVPPAPDHLIIKSALHDVKALLNEARVPLNSDFEVEYSHHYGIREFRRTGAVIINCINREYCKKVIVQLPGQKHPAHFHKLKEETFQVLHGVLNVSIDGHLRVLHPGETCLVQPGVWHSFWTETGVVFEEISTTHYNGDSVYKDKSINKLPRESRKTVVDHWGRFQVGLKAKPQPQPQPMPAPADASAA